MRKVYFTRGITADPEKMMKQLNLMLSSTSTEKKVQRVQAQVEGVIQSIAAPVIPPETSAVARHRAVSVAAGSNFIAFTSELVDDQWGFVRCDLITDAGDLSPLVQSVTQKRADGFYVTVPESGTLYYYVARYD